MMLVPDEIIEMPAVEDEAEAAPAVVGVGTILGVLVGERQAILTAFHARGTIWLGALFTLVAALARDYDAADLLRQPWWLIVPAGASAAIGLVIYALARIGVKEGPGFWAGYWGFLGVIWLMSPMAILYGIPWERMVDSGTAARANLWTLGLVSFWRVVLTTRLVREVMGLWPVGAFCRVMLVAGSAALLVLNTIPAPMFQLMGGIRQTAGEAVVASTIFIVQVLGVLTIPLWAIPGLILLIWGNGKWSAQRGESVVRVKGSAFVAAGVCMIPFLMVLPTTQREQRLRSEAEALMTSGQVDAALDYMSAHRRQEFPPQWIAPPLIGWNRAEKPEVMEVLDRVIDRKVEGWVRDEYVQKFERRWLVAGRHGYVEPRDWLPVKKMLARLPAEVTERNRWNIEAMDDWVEATAPTTTGPAEKDGGPPATAPARGGRRKGTTAPTVRPPTPQE